MNIIHLLLMFVVVTLASSAGLIVGLAAGAFEIFHVVKTKLKS